MIYRGWSELSAYAVHYIILIVMVIIWALSGVKRFFTKALHGGSCWDFGRNKAMGKIISPLDAMDFKEIKM